MKSLGCFFLQFPCGNKLLNACKLVRNGRFQSKLQLAMIWSFLARWAEN